ncbi:hypothetical protein C8K63_11361 [Pseudomonas sp. GV085]|nr:hypothetical protein C8K63_11361 [Pseudomonas sp. GV085]
MVANDNAGCLIPRCVLGFIASRLAPTVLSAASKKCVHRNVTIGAIYVCTFSFSAPKSYISFLITSPTSSLSKNKYLFNRSI